MAGGEPGFAPDRAALPEFGKDDTIACCAIGAGQRAEAAGGAQRSVLRTAGSTRSQGRGRDGNTCRIRPVSHAVLVPHALVLGCPLHHPKFLPKNTCDWTTALSAPARNTERWRAPRSRPAFGRLVRWGQNRVDSPIRAMGAATCTTVFYSRRAFV
ncbi:hypothetical protein GGTG_05634 [Gaeumannomyces tritici R3-111a-1]|uniref:Uncharacterized protein n=1 Tax=Gaeumannomyces tritici (strain R3-111a-1) TaxID=644352 RepID=J3NWH0_GAET3|nr:hypothetical protein GGTG_05634 [Gaeumannomyces tritici R3-111a-1]EJT75702.1 hypothetical protein GGTG_05634 [Gaeumannomyces tritici R3-111a-1]